MLKRIINEAIELMQWTDPAKLAIIDIWLTNAVEIKSDDLADHLTAAINKHNLTLQAIASGDHIALANKCQVPVEVFLMLKIYFVNNQYLSTFLDCNDRLLIMWPNCT